MSKITTNDVLALTGRDGTFFSVGFYKRPKPLGKRALARGEVQPTKGEHRVYPSCRFGVKKDLVGTGPKYDAAGKNLLVVWVPKPGLNPEDQEAMADDKNGDYRSIPCENITFVNTHTKRYEVVDGVLVETINDA